MPDGQEILIRDKQSNTKAAAAELNEAAAKRQEVKNSSEAADSV